MQEAILMFLSTSVAVPSMAVTFQLLPQNNFMQITSTARDGILPFSKMLRIYNRCIASQTLQLGGQEAFMIPVYFQTQRIFA